MSYNLVEAARKLAKLPAFTRTGIRTDSGRVTQEQFADFVFAVGSIGNDVADERDKLKDSLAISRDENHAQALRINKLERRQWAESVKGSVKQAATSLDLAEADTALLVGSVSDVA